MNPSLLWSAGVRLDVAWLVEFVLAVVWEVSCFRRCDPLPASELRPGPSWLDLVVEVVAVGSKLDVGAGFLSFLYLGCRLTRGISAWLDAYGVPGCLASSGIKGGLGCVELGMAAGDGVVLMLRMMESGLIALRGSLLEGNRGSRSRFEGLPAVPEAVSSVVGR